MNKADFRKRVIETLQLLSSRSDQLEYQSHVPIADVSAELFCAWDEVFSPRYDLSSAFSPEEQTALIAFHDVFERVARLLPHNPLPPIHEFVHSPHWMQLSKAASRTLHVLQTSVTESSAQGNK